MRRYIFTITTLTAVTLTLFSGCGSSRGGDCDKEGSKGAKIDYQDPTAIIDVNSTTHTYYDRDKAYTLDRAHIENPFIFSPYKSHDNDENNQSITKYVWNITSSFSPSCVDINNTFSNNLARFAFKNTDVNETCREEATKDGEIDVTLTVTDDEGKSNSTTKQIKTN